MSYCSRFNALNCSYFNITTNGCEKRNFVHKHDVSTECDISVRLKNIFWHGDIVRNDRIRFGAYSFSLQDFKEMIKNNLILNCPVTLDDIERASKMYGANIAALKGKTVRTNSEPVIDVEVIDS